MTSALRVQAANKADGYETTDSESNDEEGVGVAGGKIIGLPWRRRSRDSKRQVGLCSSIGGCPHDGVLNLVWCAGCCGPAGYNKCVSGRATGGAGRHLGKVAVLRVGIIVVMHSLRTCCCSVFHIRILDLQ